jgi:hypothetical protein
LGLILTVALRSCLLGVLPNILSEEVWDVSRVGYGFRLTQNLGFSEKSGASLFHYFWFDFDGFSSSSPLGVLAEYFCLRRFGRESSRVRVFV